MCSKMKKVFLFILLALSSHAQVQYRNLQANDNVITNEQDAVAIAVNGQTNTAYTGNIVYTNGASEIKEVYLSGFRYQTITNALEGL